MFVSPLLLFFDKTMSTTDEENAIFAPAVDGSKLVALGHNGPSNVVQFIATADAFGPVSIKGKRKSKRKSDVWDHFTKFLYDEGNKKARCNLCDVVYVVDTKRNGTYSLRNHMNICIKQSLVLVKLSLLVRNLEVKSRFS